MNTTLEVRLSDEASRRLKQVAVEKQQTEPEVAAELLEGALAADELELTILRQRLMEADAGGPFARHDEVLAWLRTLSKGRPSAPPEATEAS